MKSPAQQVTDILTHIAGGGAHMTDVIYLLRVMLKNFEEDEAEPCRSIESMAQYYVIELILRKQGEITGRLV